MTPTRTNSIGPATPAELVENYASADAAALEASKPPVRVAGGLWRFAARQAAGFATFPDQASVWQILRELDIVGPRAFRTVPDAGLGDFVGLNGHFLHQNRRTHRVGYSSRCLSKALLPLPEKWHGLSDVEVSTDAIWI